MRRFRVFASAALLVALVPVGYVASAAPGDVCPDTPALADYSPKAVEYGTSDAGARLCLDEYLYSTSASTPAVLLIHGGGFRQGDKRAHTPDGRPVIPLIASKLQAAKFNVYVANYSLVDDKGHLRAGWLSTRHLRGPLRLGPE